MVICLERGANDLHMVQLMPLPPRHLLLQQNPEWFNFLVPATQVVLEKRPLVVCVFACVCVCVLARTPSAYVQKLLHCLLLTIRGGSFVSAELAVFLLPIWRKKT